MTMNQNLCAMKDITKWTGIIVFLITQHCHKIFSKCRGRIQRL